jgi:hypothetical protein
VLAEAGYRCATPNCRTILAIDLHHLIWVSEGGPDDASNLLALCPTCHALHHRGEIPHEALTFWKANLRAGVIRSVVPLTKTSEPLRILYFHAEPRSSGIDYLHAPGLAQELERRGHLLRYCWAIHSGPLANDAAGVGRDLLHPQAVIEWKPDALVFENGFFVGLPRIPPELLNDLEGYGAVAIIEIPPSEYHSNREAYDPFLRLRGIEVETSQTSEPPRCRSFSASYLVSEVEVLRRMSVVTDDHVYEGVSSVAAASAVPVSIWRGTLLVGGNNVHVKAYGNSRIHMAPHPTYGVLVDQQWRTEAVILAHVLFESSEYPGNAIYFANLLQWMRSRSEARLERGVKVAAGLPNSVVSEEA